MPQNDLPSDVADLLQSELEPGEQVVWSGQPIPGRFVRRSIPVVLFGVPWTGFALFWTAGASGFRFPDFSRGFGFFSLFGVPFVLIGLLMLSSPYWALRKARRTAYAVTNRRVLLLDGGEGRSTTIRSFEPRRLGDLRRVQNPDGSGNLIFERTWAGDGDGGRQSTDHGFFAIRDVKHVETVVRQLHASAKTRDA